MDPVAGNWPFNYRPANAIGGGESASVTLAQTIHLIPLFTHMSLIAKGLLF